MNYSLRFLAVMAWSLLSAPAYGADGGNDTPAKNSNQLPAGYENLSVRLDELVKTAEKKARASLEEKVTSRDQALRRVAGDEAKSYQVLEHNGWWIVAYSGEQGKPVLWMAGAVIRKNSKEIYHFGSW